MAMTESFYVTTPIYYVNGAPHLGHAYTTIAADTSARYHRMRGTPTKFVTGTDEHGQKIEESATAQETTPKKLADEISETFRSAWKALGIKHDDFIRTTEPRHKKVVADIWNRLQDSGDIYLGSYDGWYCVGCEAFYQDADLAEGKKCPTHEKEVTWVSEPSYFFRMSKYQDALIKHFEDNKDFVQPKGYYNEILSFIKSGLRDLSISRTTFSWGIPVPNDDKHVIYVWIDALTNYISALGGPEGKDFELFWKNSYHIIGKDILRFHAVYWPCMLLSAGLPLPKSIVTHGWWTVGRKKLSKSIPTTRVDPEIIAKDLGNDPLRYYLLREIPLGPDGDFDYDSLFGRYQAELANDLGNLLNRSLSMFNKYFSDVPQVSADAELKAQCQNASNEAAAHYEAFSFSKGLEATWALIRNINKYIDENKPWMLAKSDAPEDKEKLAAVMMNALEAIAWSARLTTPVLPESTAKIFSQMPIADGLANQWPVSEDFGKQVLSVGAPTPVFPRIEKDDKDALIAKWQAHSAPPAEPTNQISFDDFSKVEMRTGTIEAAEKIEKAKKLLKLSVNVGEAKPRQIVAGIAEAFAPEALIGKQVIVVTNLKPAKIRGVESQGMILAVGDKKILDLATAAVSCPPGSQVR